MYLKESKFQKMQSRESQHARLAVSVTFDSE